MANDYTAVDLSKLNPPKVVEAVAYEAILGDMLAALKAFRDSEGNAVYDAIVESDPAYKVLEVAAYRETLLRQNFNDRCVAVLLAYAEGDDLDQIGANYNVARLTITPADPDAIPPVEAVMESDADFRRRIQLSFEGFSTAGPEGAYVFHALSSDPDVLDAWPISPNPGEVVLYTLSRSGNGAASPELLATVLNYLGAADKRPLTDQLTTASAGIVQYSIEAQLYFFSGLDREAAMAQAQTEVEQLAEDYRRIGRDVPLSAIYAALQQPGVQRVELIEPEATVSVSEIQAPYCSGITLTDGGVSG
ncbi:baseplate assembly protein [Terasakiella sp.]|uniref:baseplate assembly protein n=1 Tax=Terasakiella sp. TaxID=2034861 RepID=UPI003AA7F704